MAGQIIEVPDFEYTSFYYPDIYRALILYNRIYAPEITDEDQHEPYIQLLKSYALSAHLNNVNLDIVANEALFGTARLLESMRNWLALIAVKLEHNLPASAEVLLEFSKVFTSSVNIVPEGTQFATEETDDTPQIIYQATGDNQISRTDRPTAVYQHEASVFGANHSGALSTVGVYVDMFNSEPVLNTAFYVGHDSIMFDTVEFEYNTPGSGISGVWEYYDGDTDDTKPDAVTNLGSNLRFDLTDLLGDEDRSGSLVKVVLNSSSAYEEVESIYSGGKNIIETVGLLGQSSVSTDVDDYTVGSNWNPLKNVIDGTNGFTEEGKIEFDLPQDETQNWIKSIVNGVEAFWIRFRVTGYQKTSAYVVGTNLKLEDLDPSNYNIKIKIDEFASTVVDVTGDNGASAGTYTLSGVISQINSVLSGVDASLNSVASNEGGQLKLSSQTVGQQSQVKLEEPGANDATKEILGLTETTYPHTYNGIGGIPNIDRLLIDSGKQYLLVEVVQGRSTSDDPLGSSNGSPNQEFEITNSPIIDGTLRLEIDEGDGFTEWSQVDNFLNSTNISKDYRLDIKSDDTAVVIFGSGSQGKIPNVGSNNIRAFYSIGADVNGNVGARTITVNKSGIAFVNRVYNPRQATGWKIKEGATPEDIERLKIEGPATLLTRGRAISPEDAEFLATKYRTENNSQLIERAIAFEETFGVKTLEVVAVGIGGNQLSLSQREDVEDYFNGNKTKEIEGILVSNHEITVTNYDRKIIDIEVEVSGGNPEEIKNALIALLTPTAKYDDGYTYRWTFQDTVPRSLMITEITNVDPKAIKNVNLITPATDPILGERELPFPGTITVNIV